MRTVFIIDNLGRAGAQRQLVRLAGGLKPEYPDLSVITLSGENNDLLDEFTEQDISVLSIPQHGKVDCGAFLKLYRYIRRSKPDVVYTWLFTAGLYGRLASILAGVPTVILGMRNTVDDMPFHHRLVSKMLCRRTDLVTINAEAIRSGVRTALGVPDEKIRCIHNGIDIPGVVASDAVDDCRAGWHTGSGQLVVGMAGRMAPQKDYMCFLEAARKSLDDGCSALFLIAGDGPLRAKIEKRIGQLGLADHVRLLGVRKDIPLVLQALDVFVLSTNFEGCSNVIMEAMAAGKPVVATDAGGNGELIVHEKTGLLVGRNDAGSLGKAITRLSEDAALRARMGTAGQNRMKNEFSTVAMVDRTRDMLNRCTGKEG